MQIIPNIFIFLHVLFVFLHCKYTGDGKPADNVSTSVPPAYLRKKETVTRMDYRLDWYR